MMWLQSRTVAATFDSMMPLGNAEVLFDPSNFRGRLPTWAATHLLRDELSVELLVTSLDGVSVSIFRRDEFEKFVSHFLVHQREGAPAVRSILFIAQACGSTVTMDTQGRFQLPQAVRDTIGLDAGLLKFRLIYEFPSLKLLREQDYSLLLEQHKFGAESAAIFERLFSDYARGKGA